MGYSPLQLANAFLKTGELDDARKTLAEYLQTSDIHQSADGQEALRMWIDLLARGDTNDQRLALSEYERLITLSATDHIKQAMLHYQLGEATTACQLLQTALSQFPDDARLCESLLFLYKQTADWKAGLAVLQSLPAHWIWMRWAGDFAGMAGDWKLAIQHYSDALTHLERHYAIPKDSPATYLKLPHISDAEALTIVGVYAEILLARADMFRKNMQLSQAQADIASAKQLLPHDPTIG